MLKTNAKIISLIISIIMILSLCLTSCSPMEYPNDDSQNGGFADNGSGSNNGTTNENGGNSSVNNNQNLGGDSGSNGGSNGNHGTEDGESSNPPPSHSHSFVLCEQVSPTEKSFGYKYSKCSECNEEKTELVSPTAQTVANPTESMSELSVQFTEKSLADAEYIFEKCISLNKADIFNMPFSDIPEFLIIRDFTLELVKDAETETEKAKIIFDWLVENIEYDINYLTASPYESFVDKKAVCFGYTVLMHDMLSAVGIMSIYASGLTHESGVDNLDEQYIYYELSRPQDDSHAWIYAYVDGEVVICDPTWGNYFANLFGSGFDLTKEDIAKTHLPLNLNAITIIPETVDDRLFRNATRFIGERIFNLTSGEHAIVDYGVIQNSIFYNLHVYDGYKYAESGIYGAVLSDGFHYLKTADTNDVSSWFYALPDGKTYTYNEVINYVLSMKEFCGKDIEISKIDEFYLKDGICYRLEDGAYSVYSVIGTMTSVTIPSEINGISVMNIADNAFKGNGIIESITVSRGIEYIGSSAFQGMTALRTLVLPETLRIIETFAVSDTNLLTLVIPDSVSTLGENAIFENRYLKTVTLPASLSEFLINPIQHNPSLEAVYITDNAYYKSVDGVIFTKDGKTLAIYPQGSPRTSYTVPYGVEKIGISAFAFSENLKFVTLPEGLKRIDESGFQWCLNLVEINIPKTVTDLGVYAFYNCTALKSIVIPEGITSLEAVFDRCTMLETVTIPKTVTELRNAFNFCSSMKTYILAPDNPAYKLIDGVIFTKDGRTLVSFPSGRGDESYTVPRGTTSISYAAFCSSDLKTLILPDGFLDFDTAPGQFLDNLTVLVLPDTVTTMLDIVGSKANIVVYTYFRSRDSVPDAVTIPYYLTVYWLGEWEMVSGVPTPIVSGNVSGETE